MIIRPAAYLATAALAIMPMLGACGSGARPTSSSPAPSAPPAASTGMPTAAPASTTTAANPGADPTPSAEQAKVATKGFVRTSYTVGYPDHSIDDYLDRLKPLVTESSFTELKKTFQKDTKVERAVAALNKQLGRRTVKLTSGVKVSSISAEKATTKLNYRLITQVRSGSSWKTVKTASYEDTDTVHLVNVGGKWLVDVI